MVDLASRLRALGGVRAMAVAALAGAALALAQPPVSWPLACFLALPPLLWLVDGASGPRAAFARGWAAGVGCFAAGLFWIVEPFLVDPQRHGWMAPFALILMAGGLALFWGAAFALARALWRPGFRRVLILACVWTLAEFARSQVLTGFPWGLIAYGWIETPVAQVAAVLGPHGLGFLTLLAGLSAGAALGRAGALGGVALAAALVAAGWGFGALRLAAPVPERPAPVVVRLVQPNAAQHLKWRSELQQEFYDRQIAATRAPGAPRPDVTIWSETAVPFVLGYSGDLLADVAAAAAPEGLVMLGIRRLEAGPDGDAWFNSLAVLEPGGAAVAVYDKYRLVPFGEYIPFAGAIARLGLPRLDPITLSGFTRGPGPQLVSVAGRAAVPAAGLLRGDLSAGHARARGAGRMDRAGHQRRLVRRAVGSLSAPGAGAVARDRAGPAAGACGQHRRLGDDRSVRPDRRGAAARRPRPCRCRVAGAAARDDLRPQRRFTICDEHLGDAPINCLKF